MVRPGSLALSFVVSICLAMPELAAQPVRIMDVPSSSLGFGTQVFDFREISQGKALISLPDRTLGVEPWLTDGTPGGTYPLADTWPGPQSGVWFAAFGLREGFLFEKQVPSPLRNVLFRVDGASGRVETVREVEVPLLWTTRSPDRGHLFFPLSEGRTEYWELWLSDGSSEGTRAITPLDAGPEKRPRFEGVFINGYAYFAIGSELWRTDGTAEGTELVYSGLLQIYQMVSAGDELYLLARDSERPGVWHVQETTVTRLEEAPGLTENLVRGIPHDDGVFIDVANHSSADPWEVWYVHGPSRVARQVAITEALLPRPSWPAVDGGRLMVLPTPEYGNELWISDGTIEGTQLIRDICPGTCSADPTLLYEMEAEVLFAATEPDHGRELWATDGTPEGTHLVRDLIAGPSSSSPWAWPRLGTDLLLAVPRQHPAPRVEVLRVEDAGRGPVTGVFEAPGALRYLELSPHPDARILALTSSNQSWELWSLDGTAHGNQLLRRGSWSQTLAQAVRLLRLDETLFVLSSDGLHRVFGMDSESVDHFEEIEVTLSSPTYLADDRLYLWADSLWQVERMGAPVRRDRPESCDPVGPVPSGFLMYCDGDELVVLLEDGATRRVAGELGARSPSLTSATPPGSSSLFFGLGGELWSSDGTSQGTRAIKRIRSGSLPSVWSVTPHSDSRVYFVADDGIHGTELWRSDGTLDGTSLVVDALPGPEGSDPQLLTSAASGFYFTAQPEAEVRSVYSVAGAGVDEVSEQGRGTTVPTLAVGERGVFWIATDDSGGRIWLHDGEVARLLGEVAGEGPFDAAAVSGGFLFSSPHPALGSELWSTDGSPSGTRVQYDIAPGIYNSSPFALTATSDRIFFVADEGLQGPGLWTFDQSEFASPVPAAAPEAIKSVSGRVAPGELIEYEIVVRNPGTLPLRNAGGDELVDRLPDELVLVDAWADSGIVSWDVETGTVRWNGDLAALSEVRVVITARIVHVGVIENRAEFSYDSDGDGRVDRSVFSSPPGGSGPTVLVPTPATAIPVLGPAGFLVALFSFAALGMQRLRRER